MEKFKSVPEIPKPAEQPMYHGSEDVILDKLHRCTDGSADCTPQDAEMMHKDFETCESYQLYDAYVKNRIPSLDRMETGIKGLLGRIPEKLRDDPEAQRLAKLLSGRAPVIRGNVRSYVETVLRFVRIQNTSAAMRDPEIFVKIDHERRRKHENLLKTLADTRKLFDDAYDFGLIEKKDFHEWLPGDDAEMPESAVPIFSQQAVANRDLIKNWALAADFAEHYQKLHDMLEQKE